jgi:16S rRNA (guanine966-N2)-methyltransferase
MAKRQNPNDPRRKKPGESAPAADTDIRIIGGTFRGRRLRYHGDPVVRPMKHRVREAIFNLITTDSVGRHAIDLYAGTGALALEALSRGATHATLIEKHVPTARVIEENIRTLGVEEQTTLLVTSAFLWAKRDLPALNPQPSTLNPPWLVFCSPPYDFFIDRQAEMLELIQRLQDHAPPGSTLVVESDGRFDTALLGDNWLIRAYPPAVVAIWRKTIQAE